MKRILFCSLFLLLLAGCNAAASMPDKAADLAAVNQLRDGFVSAFNANDAEAVGNLYSEDAVSMGGNQPTQEGRQAIVAANKMMFDQFSARITITPKQTEVFGDHGYDRGTFSLELTPKAGGPAVTSEGRYLVLVMRGLDGSWKVTEDIDNSAMPPATPPAAGAGTK